MRGRKHPLEVYQRARPFAAEEERRARPRSKPRSPGARAPGKWRQGAGRMLTRVGQRLGRIRLRRVAVFGSALVLILAGAYAVWFWPPPENSDASGPSLRSEWRDPVPPDAPTPPGTYWIQVASGGIPGPEDPEGHQTRVEEWQRQAASVQRQIDAKLAKELPGVHLRVEAVYADMESRNDIRLLVGTWADKNDAEIPVIREWLQRNGFEDAFLRPTAMSLDKH